jgi:putative PIN family toxin of toxin-antitoxin system
LQESRYLLDTNILISGLLFKGNERTLLILGREKKAFLMVSDVILKEFQRVLADKFSFEQADVDLALAYVLESVREIVVLEPQDYNQKTHDLRDGTDIHLLIAVKKTNATLVTGDRDLLEAHLAVEVMKCADVLTRITKSPDEERVEGRGSKTKIKEK